RRPIRTFVGEYDEELVQTALRREQARAGQAFYLHNRVETIDEAAERLRQLCPELRFIVAHGQMREKELEEHMLSFLAGDADVLLSTTIIESGLDIPQANTLIVDRADALGLAQLYQIRGRVGRSDVTAHAYLFYPDSHALTADEDELRELHAATEDRYGPVPEPVENLFAIQEAKLKLARLGADYLVFRGGRATVGPLDFGSGELRALRGRVDTAVYTSAR